MADLFSCRSQFPSLSRKGGDGRPLVYLDGPGGSQVPESVIQAISGYYAEHNANTHGQFVTSRESDAVIEGARADVAALLHAGPGSTISFGQNMTTLNFLLAQGIASLLLPGDEVIVTDLDHDANVAPFLSLQSRGVVVRRAPITAEATLDLQAFAGLISSRTRLIAVGFASNAVGTVNPVSTLRSWARDAGSLFLVDAVHWAPHGPIDVTSLDPDFLLCSAYKFFGPHIGVLYARPGALDAIPTLKVAPQRDAAPEKIETGTLNHAALAGVSAAVAFIASLAETRHPQLSETLAGAMEAIYAYEHGLARRLYAGLIDLPGVTVHGPAVGEELRAPTLSFSVAGRSSAEIAAALGERGVLAWDGDFYAVNLVDRLGLRSAGGLVRLGLAPYNTAEEIDRTLTSLAEILETRRATAATRGEEIGAR